MNDLNHLIISLLQLKGVGRKKVKLIMEIIHKPRVLSLKEIIEIGQAFHIITTKINQDEIDKAINDAETIIHECKQQGINCITYLDEAFPGSLNFNDYPVLLFYKGNLEILNHSKRAAVIGSRTPTKAGSDLAFYAGKMLAENDFVVISGLATGCDTSGHMGCLSIGGKTVAFLPSGLSEIYPASNQVLAEKILTNGGCLISEYNHDETVQPYKFVERDRLQSGTSQFLIVSSFAPGSGTIHTLTYAKQYHKQIYSISDVYEESKEGFACIKEKNINFTILERSELKQIVENFKLINHL